jgi:hypothetical protein
MMGAPSRKERLRETLNEVLGLELPSPQRGSGDEGDPDADVFGEPDDEFEQPDE